MYNKLHILIVEDDPSISNYILTALKMQDYRVSVAMNGAKALSMITSRCPDLILLDLGLPDMDGIDVIRQVREWSSVPIIVISARTQERDKVQALDLGADDYVTKPFGPSELLARIRTAIRHINRSSDNSSVYEVGDLKIDFEKRLVSVKGVQAHLTVVEYKPVSLLAQNAGKVITYDMIMTHIWGPYAEADNRILRVNMANVRRKLEENPAEPKYIFTEIGIGYRMVDNNN